MDILIEIVEWIAVVVGGFAVAGALVVAAMAWLLNRPIDGEPRRNARRS